MNRTTNPFRPDETSTAAPTVAWSLMGLGAAALAAAAVIVNVSMPLAAALV